MTTLIHGASHHSSVKVGDTKKFVSVVWTKESGTPIEFAGWFLPVNVVAVQGASKVTLATTQDYDGRDQVEATFIDTGIVDFEITLGTKVTPLRIEVVA